MSLESVLVRSKKLFSSLIDFMGGEEGADDPNEFVGLSGLS
jgi:hypothetical protein